MNATGVSAQRDEPAAAPDSSTVELHSDMGLFIVMTPAEYVGLSGPEAAAGAGASAGGGLLLELASGEMVAPEVPAGALLVMNGDGMERWMRLGGGAAPHSPGHEVLLPEGGLAGHGRAWFGRMFLPPKDARLPDGSLSFGEYRAAAAAALAAGGAASAAGCSPSRRRVELEEVTPCAAGEVYCWMSCMQVSAGLDCDPATMLCEEAGTGLLWPQDFLDPSSGDPVHCYDCGLTCPAPVPQQPPGKHRPLPPHCALALTTATRENKMLPSSIHFYSVCICVCEGGTCRQAKKIGS